MKLPSAHLNVRVPHELWQKLAQFVDDGFAKDASSAIRILIIGGFKLVEIKNEIDDPKRVQELANQWNSKMNENDIFGWVSNLSDHQIEAVQGAINITKEQRSKH